MLIHHNNEGLYSGPLFLYSLIVLSISIYPLSILPIILYSVYIRTLFICLFFSILFVSFILSSVNAIQTRIHLQTNMLVVCRFTSLCSLSINKTNKNGDELKKYFFLFSYIVIFSIITFRGNCLLQQNPIWPFFSFINYIFSSLYFFTDWNKNI